MSAGDKPTCWSIFKCLFALAGAAGIAPGAALAQDCKLSVHASPQVLYSGQTANVNVLAHIPTPPAPGGAYAFASSTFDVFATDPMWTLASAGAIVGNDVLGIDASQAHQPQLRIFADPANPHRAWSGVFKPQSNGPALIEIEADPIDFFVYPSKLTSSAAECDAEGGSDFIFVNPLRVGGWLAAPAAGMAIKLARNSGVLVSVTDMVIDPFNPLRVGIAPIKVFQCPSDPYVSASGRISSITADISDPPSVRSGWTGSVLLDSSTTIGFDQAPSSFTATVQNLGAGDDVFQWDPGDGDAARPDAQRSRVGSMTVTFTGLETGGYTVGANYSHGVGRGLPNVQIRDLELNGFIGGVYVGSGDFNDDGQVPALVVESLPQTIAAKVGSRLLILQEDGTYGGSTSAGDYGIWQDNYGITLLYDQPVLAVVRGANGQPQTVTLDRIEVHGSQQAAQWDNLKQTPLSLGSHVFEAEGVKQMSITPGQGD